MYKRQVLVVILGRIEIFQGRKLYRQRLGIIILYFIHDRLNGGTVLFLRVKAVSYTHLFQVTMVSSYLVLNKLRLIDTVWAVILPGAASTFPVFIMTRFFMAIPETIMEAAAVDGASPFQIFVRLGIPLGASRCV